MALSDFGRVWKLARGVEDLFGLQKEVRETLGVINQRLRALEDRMTRLESRQEQCITEARNAAVVMASSVIAEAVTRITRLEGRADELEQKRLAPP